MRKSLLLAALCSAALGLSIATVVNTLPSVDETLSNHWGYVTQQVTLLEHFADECNRISKNHGAVVAVNTEYCMEVPFINERIKGAMDMFTEYAKANKELSDFWIKGHREVTYTINKYRHVTQSWQLTNATREMEVALHNMRNDIRNK